MACNSTTPELTIAPGLNGNQSTGASIEARLRQLAGDSLDRTGDGDSSASARGKVDCRSPNPIPAARGRRSATRRCEGSLADALDFRLSGNHLRLLAGVSVVNILEELLRSDPSLLYAFLHDKDQRFRQKVETIAWLKETPPWCFTAMYTAGEDAYDQSFDIERQDGSYLGECGMVISDVAADDPESGHRPRSLVVRQERLPYVYYSVDKRLWLRQSATA